MNPLRSWLAAVIVSATMASLAESGGGADWPMWGCDAARSGVSPETLPATLHLNWVLKLRSPDPAWHANQSKLQFDRQYEPVVAGNRMFIGSMASDRVTAYDAASGQELWRFYADGPVRFAPAVWNDKLYFVSDDGFLYCLRTSDGAVAWKYKGGPSDQKVLGNDRFIDIYPARGAPVVYDGTVYFAASIWPLMGVFVHALDAETGEVLWTNSGTGSIYIPQQHDALAFSGIAPQGYLAATQDMLLVAGGQTVPAGFDRQTGKLLHFNLHSRRMGTKGGGGYYVRAAKDFFVSRSDIFRLSDGKFLAKAKDPIIPKSSILGVDADGSIYAYARGMKTKPDVDRKGRDVVVATLKLNWKEPTSPPLDRVFLMAGSRLYGATDDGRIAAVDVSEESGAPNVSWTSQIDGTPLAMIAAHARLYVSTDRGEVHCYSGEPPSSENPVVQSEIERVSEPESLVAAAPGASRDASKSPSEASPRSSPDHTLNYLLEESGATRGYCLLLGIGSGQLLDALLDQTELHIIALDPDENKVAATRRRLDDADVYGTRADVLVGDVFSIRLPPYIANVIVSEDIDAAGLGRGGAFVEKIFPALRPYGGVACLKTNDAEHEAFNTYVSDADLARAEVTRSSGCSLLKRVGPLPGSGDWTHHNGDAGNSVVSGDQLVRAPLGILWFGGPSNEKVLPRHGHGPAPQVVGGRLFIEGPHMLRAVDVYNGQLLWERGFADLGKFYVSTNHSPGAGAIGSNYASTEDGVYVIHGTTCHYLAAATGDTIAEFRAPPLPDDTQPKWGFIAVLGDMLIGGIEPHEFSTFAFNTYEMRRYRGDRARPIRDAIKAWKHFDTRQIRSGEPEHVYLVDQLNRLLFSEGFLARIPGDVREKAAARAVERELEAYLAGDRATETDPTTIAIKRRLLEAYYPLPKYSQPPIGSFGNTSYRGSKRLIGMDRRTGEVLWQVEARGTFRHNTIAAGNGKVFALDRLPADIVGHQKLQGIQHQEQERLIAIDLRTGKEIWDTIERIFGTWLGYSNEFDVLLQAGSASGDRALDEVGQGMVAYQGADGTVLWENNLNYRGPCMLHRNAVITQAPAGFSLNLLTGERKTRIHPLTRAEVDWSYSRNRGCNTAIASENLITFRSSAAGFYDLAGDGGTGNLGGFRSGCTSNLIPADGVLSAPDYTRTCTCSFQNRTSLALIHMPAVEMWTFNAYRWDENRVRRLGLNFGAPGDRRDPSGLLWLDYPSVGGDSPDVPVSVEGSAAEYFRYHPSHIEDGRLNWVESSGIQGASDITIKLSTKDSEPEKPYFVRLYFAEIDKLRAGERLFDVHLQGQRVLADFDIAQSAGGPKRGVVKEFREVSAGSALQITLTKRVGKTLLCGVEIVAEGW